MVDSDQLSVVVTVGGSPVTMSAVGNGNWSGNIDLTPGRSHQVVVSWNENFNQQALLLARAQKTVVVSAGDTESIITIGSNEFNTSFDSDSDGRSNLAERDAGSDPFDSNSPEAPPTFVTANIQLNISTTFQAATGTSEELTMVALVNNRSVDLTRSELTWLGSVRLPENTDAFINAQLYRDSTQNLRIGEVNKSINVGAGGLIVVPDSDFNFEFDDDADGFTNLEEILNGYNPLDSNDPTTDPCVPTTFVADCTNDADNDGDTDFQETESADTDMDTIPDYLESNIVDDDEDGFFAHEDSDEADPCIPDDTSFACINQ